MLPASINRGANRSWAIGLAALFVLAPAAGCGRAPQIAGSAKSLQASDALLTAVSAHSTSLVDQCETNLAAMRAADEISQPAYDYLQGVIVEARAGEWTSARRRLVKLIKAQQAPR